MASQIRALNDIVRERTGQSAFDGGGTGNVVFVTPLPNQAGMVANTFYFDPDAKELGWLNTSGDRCTISFVEGDRFLLENFSGRILLEDGSGFLRN